MNFNEDEQLIELIKNEDEDAFEKLYVKYQHILFYTALRLTNNEADANDAVQLTFIQIYKSIHTLREPKYFRLWMNKIIRGKCLNIFQKNRDIIMDLEENKISRQYAEEREDYLPDKKMKFTADQDILMQLIKNLPYKYREVLVLSYFSQFQLSELAEIIKIPLGTVKSRMHVAKKLLREEIEGYERNHKHRITFHIPGIFNILLLLSFQKGCTATIPFCSIFRAKSIQVALLPIALPSLVLTGALVFHSLSNLNQKESSSNSYNNLTDTISGQELNEQSSYFSLLHWAFDETQMQTKEKSEIDVILPVYEFLKNKKGAYWERLENDGWNTNFEILRKNSK